MQNTPKALISGVTIIVVVIVILTDVQAKNNSIYKKTSLSHTSVVSKVKHKKNVSSSHMYSQLNGNDTQRYL